MIEEKSGERGKKKIAEKRGGRGGGGGVGGWGEGGGVRHQWAIILA